MPFSFGIWLFPSELNHSVLLFPGIATVLFIYLLGYNARKVGDARREFKIQPPAVSGHPDFERAFRAQMNTIEFVVVRSYWVRKFVVIYSDTLGNADGFALCLVVCAVHQSCAFTATGWCLGVLAAAVHGWVRCVMSSVCAFSRKLIGWLFVI
jgi:hypothetical protein